MSKPYIHAYLKMERAKMSADEDSCRQRPNPIPRFLHLPFGTMRLQETPLRESRMDQRALTLLHGHLYVNKKTQRPTLEL